MKQNFFCINRERYIENRWAQIEEAMLVAVKNNMPQKSNEKTEQFDDEWRTVMKKRIQNKCYKIGNDEN